MIIKEIRVLQISLAEAEQKEAFKYGTYNNLKQELTFTVNHVSNRNFRLVHDNIKAYAIVEGQNATITSTLFDVKEFNTEKEALDEIVKLGLEYDPPEDPEDEIIDDVLDNK